MKKELRSGRSYGFSQGRLTRSPNHQLQWFPQDKWREEFSYAAKLGCSFIELLIERERNNRNPVWSPSGRTEILHQFTKNGLTPHSLCFDYIIDHSIINDIDKTTYASLIECLTIAAELKCKVVILPLMEASSLTIENMKDMANLLTKVGLTAKSYEISLCIEALLPAEELNKFLNIINMKHVKAVFDTGNRVVESFNLKQEIIKLAKNIGHVHIKDKNKFGENVVLGSGLVDFCEVFEALNAISYQGPLNFETHRGASPLYTAEHNITLCEFFNRNSIV